MEGYRQQINNLMELSAYFTQRIRETEGYELVIDPVLALFRLQKIKGGILARIPQHLLLVHPIEHQTFGSEGEKR